MERLNRVLGALTRWGLAACALLAVLVALYVSLGRQLIPLVAEYRADVELKAQQALGLPVHIGALEGRWSGLAPVLSIRDLELGEGADTLRLDEVKAVPDLWASFKAREVRLAHIQFGGLQLILREDEQGQWALEGLPHKDDSPLDPGEALKRLRQLGRLDLFDSQVTLQPWQRDPLTLTYVSLGLQAGASRQSLDVRATLPDGQPLAMSLRTRATAKAWRDGRVEAYVSLPQSDWARWLPPRLLGQWQAATLHAGGEFWVDWSKGQLQHAVVRLNAPRLKGAYADRKAVTLDDLALNAWFKRSGDGFDVTVDSLAASIGKDRWESHLQLAQRAGNTPAEESWKIQADRLELTPLTPLINALAPLPDKLLTVVNALKVTGNLRNVQLDLHPKAEGDQRVQFAANLEKVGFDAYHGAPAAGNVSGAISGDLGHGELRLDTDAFMLHLYPIFGKPWHYQKANARLTWAIDKQTFTLVAPYIKVLGEEGKIAADFLIRLHLEPGHEDYMDLRVGLTEGDGRYTAKYLPEVLSPALDEWLRSAIVKGNVDEGYFQYQGSLNHGAPAHARDISLFFKVHDATLDYQPGWPKVTQVEGDVFIEDTGVRVKARRGLLLDTKVSNVNVDIPHVEAGKESHLYLDGSFDGSLVDGLKILQQAPIGTGETFAAWEGEGPLAGKVKLDIPLARGPRPKVLVDFATAGATLKIAPPSLELTDLTGDFSFDIEKGLSAKDLSLQAFGKPLSAQIVAEGKNGQFQTRVSASGQMPVRTLTEWLQVQQALPVSGEVPYQLQVSLGARDNRLTVNSSLKGVAIDLPAPFGKTAAQTRDSRFSMTLQGAERRIDAAYADLARFAYAAPADKLGQGRGELMLGTDEAIPPSGQGLRVRGRLDSLDLDPWQQKAAHLAGSDPGGSARQLLQSVDLSIGQLKAYGVDLNQAVVRLARGGPAWELRVDSKEVAGSARIPDAKAAPMTIRLQTLRLPPADPAQEQDENAPDPLASFDPRKMPPLDLAIDKLYRGDDLYGSASLKLRQTPRGLGMDDIDLNFKGLHLDGNGGWEGVPGSTSSWYKGRLDGKDLGEVLKAWGFAPTVTSRDFRMDVDGRWPGSPAWVSINRFSGSMNAALRSGQFVEVEGSAQALRVFGLLNFNSIGRRLRLDFSDLFSKGLAYDRVKGLLVASEGVYVTREPISVTGPSSNFELDGTLDFVRDRIDAKLLVTLPVTNNLPLAALIVGAPAVGGALFLVDRLIGDRVSRFASVHYRVDGPIKEPKITFVKPFDK
ncbi:YhdP family protein [Pseudomonas farsensis]|uniref:YhdP family protein n=1 Tax=Pseudomonas farsensis TaxID=2745492 RepID=A0ABU8QT66_9PSED